LWNIYYLLWKHLNYQKIQLKPSPLNLSWRVIIGNSFPWGLAIIKGIDADDSGWQVLKRLVGKNENLWHTENWPCVV
jgi:hypothetical protein